MTELSAAAPLADRMRPRTLDEFVGQERILGPGRLLRRAIEADRLSSIILHGPPGTGKTTLARVIANTTRSHFVTLNAVLSGVKDIREAIDGARTRLSEGGQRTILFVDEVHRFNKSQQDALLPWVENGTVVLVGATTENPYFEVNKALVSRSRVFQLVSLEDRHLEQIAWSALTDPDRGYGALRVVLVPDALAHLVNVSDGDARALLNALELAVETTPPGPDGTVTIDLAVAEESIQRRAVLYDKEGDAHYDAASAFIKSLRGSDPDAALFWLARMVYAGEDPRFLFRRMLILAAEDVGLADPLAIGVVTACAQGFEYVGLPEGQFHLTEAALYLALAPKSNSALGYFDALEAVSRERSGDVPNPLKDANRDREGSGHGEGYRYPHAYRDHWVAQQYLPAALTGRVFYRASREGAEAVLAGRTAARREAQLAASLEIEDQEVFSFTGRMAGKRRAAWLDAAAASHSGHLSAVRDAILERAALARHSVVLDVGGGPGGLLTWEAVRRTPEGGVVVLASASDADALRALAANLPELDRPQIVTGAAATAAADLAAAGLGDLRFDAIVGRGPWPAGAGAGTSKALQTAVASVAEVLAATALLVPGGRISLAVQVPGAGPGPTDLLEADSDTLLAAARRAERDALAERDQGMPGPSDWEEVARALGLVDVGADVCTYDGTMEVTAALVERWCSPTAEYRTQIHDRAGTEAADAVCRALGAATGEKRAWPVHMLHVTGRAATRSVN